MNARVSLLFTVMESWYLAINHGIKSSILLLFQVMHKYTLLKIIANYNPNIVSNYLINISENAVCALIMNKSKLQGNLIADVRVIM